MKRKIIKQGHNTLTVTLPADWARRFNMHAGSEVDLIDKDNGLFISTEKTDENKKAELDISKMDNPTIWKYMMAIYREGYDEILVKFNPAMKLDSPYKFFTHYRSDRSYGGKADKQNPLEFMHKIVNRFIGFEVVDYGKDFVLLKEISQSTSKEFDNSLRRVFFLIQQMIDEICEALQTDNTKLLTHVHDVDINLDKFHDYCVRVLNKVGNKESRKTSLLFSTLYIIELMGDEFKNISLHLSADAPAAADYKGILELSKIKKEQIDLFYEIFYKFDFDKLKRISDMDFEEYLSVKSLYKKVKSDDGREIVHHLRMISKYINALTELRIEMEF
jgi:phosphate uptake regulator